MRTVLLVALVGPLFFSSLVHATNDSSSEDPQLRGTSTERNLATTTWSCEYSGTFCLEFTGQYFSFPPSFPVAELGDGITLRRSARCYQEKVAKRCSERTDIGNDLDGARKKILTAQYTGGSTGSMNYYTIYSHIMALKMGSEHHKSGKNLGFIEHSHRETSQCRQATVDATLFCPAGAWVQELVCSCSNSDFELVQNDENIWAGTKVREIKWISDDKLFKKGARCQCKNQTGQCKTNSTQVRLKCKTFAPGPDPDLYYQLPVNYVESDLPALE